MEFAAGFTQDKRQLAQRLARKALVSRRSAGSNGRGIPRDYRFTSLLHGQTKSLKRLRKFL